MDLDHSIKMAGISTIDATLGSPLVNDLAPTVSFKATQLVLTEESPCEGPSHQYDGVSYSIRPTPAHSHS